MGVVHTSAPPSHRSSSEISVATVVSAGIDKLATRISTCPVSATIAVGASAHERVGIRDNRGAVIGEHFAKDGPHERIGVGDERPLALKDLI